MLVRLHDYLLFFWYLSPGIHVKNKGGGIEVRLILSACGMRMWEGGCKWEKDRAIETCSVRCERRR